MGHFYLFENEPQTETALYCSSEPDSPINAASLLTTELFLSGGVGSAMKTYDGWPKSFESRTRGKLSPWAKSAAERIYMYHMLEKNEFTCNRHATPLTLPPCDQLWDRLYHGSQTFLWVILTAPCVYWIINDDGQTFSLDLAAIGSLIIPQRKPGCRPGKIAAAGKLWKRRSRLESDRTSW